MSNVVTGQVQFINNPVTNNNFTSQTVIVLVDPGQYQSYVELSFAGNNMQTLISQIAPGGMYNFSVNIRGSKNMMASTKNPGNNMAFNSISVWKVEAVQGAQPQPPAQQQAQPQQNFQQQNFQQQPQQFQQQQQQPQQFQQQGGYAGQPQQQAMPQQQQFQQQPQQQQQFPSQQAQPNFANQQQGFGQPQPENNGQPAQGFGNAPAGGQQGFAGF